MLIIAGHIEGDPRTFHPILAEGGYPTVEDALGNPRLRGKGMEHEVLG